MHGLIPRLAPLSAGYARTCSDTGRVWSATGSGAIRRLRFRSARGLPIELGPSITLAIYRVVQEGLINALRHAQASRVDIAVQCDARRITATVTDDGVGLSPEWARPGHFGLRGLMERVEQLGGTFSLGSNEGRGVRLAADIPLGGPT